MLKPRLIQSFSLSFLILFSCFSFAFADSNDDSNAASSSETPIPTLQPKGQSYAKALVIHKPSPDPAWGKVVQYHSETSVDPNTKIKETVYEFVFQDDKGLIRIAKYHEGENGEGYWEVYLWDLP
jgi:hypothetical protein